MLDNKGFDSWAGVYDADVRESAQHYPFAGYEELMGRIAARMIKKRRGGAPVSVLDLGCGTGVLASRLAEAGCAVTGVDFSAEMLAEAARRCPSLRPIRADFSAGLPDGLGGGFDAVACTYAIHHLSTPQQARLLRECLGVLRPGGEVIVGDVAFETPRDLALCREQAADDWDEDENYPVAEALRAWFPALAFEPIPPCAGILTLAPAARPLDAAALFPGFDARLLRERDVPEALELCRGNGDYYAFMRSEPSAEALLADTLALPPGKGLEDKYFLLLRDEAGPLGLADIISGYPDAGTAWIGLFMLRRSGRGRGLGRRMALSLLEGAKAAGFSRAGLAWVRDNPVPARFWPSLGFVPEGAPRPCGEYELVTAYRAL